MQNLILIIHAQVQQDLGDQLRRLTQIQGFSFTPVEGHSAHSDQDPFMSARDKVVGYVPRVRVDILLEDTAIAEVLAALRTGGKLNERGIYWVTSVVEYGRL